MKQIAALLDELRPPRTISPESGEMKMDMIDIEPVDDPSDFDVDGWPFFVSLPTFGGPDWHQVDGVWALTPAAIEEGRAEWRRRLQEQRQ